MFLFNNNNNNNKNSNSNNNSNNNAAWRNIHVLAFSWHISTRYPDMHTPPRL